jgi:hypothetical protein
MQANDSIGTSPKSREDAPMALETALEIAAAIALPLWLVVEHFLSARRLSQRSGGHVAAGPVPAASVHVLRVDNSTGSALRRRTA